MSSFPFPRDESSKKKLFQEISPCASQREVRRVILPSMNRGKTELPGEKDRHSYVGNQMRNYRPAMQRGSASFDVVDNQGDAAFDRNEINSIVDTVGANKARRLLSVATQRLGEVNIQLTACKQQLREKCKVIEKKDDTIRKLQAKLSTQEMRALEQVILGLEQSDQLKILDRCIELEAQVEEMNKFFNDYGLTFVGDSRRSGDVASPRSDKFLVNFTKLLNRVAELNLYVCEGESKIVVNSQGASFKTRESVPLTLYSNGLVLFSGPFRDFDDPVTQAFVQDILDGYFPTELQRAYPDGVPFKVVDKREVIYQDARLRRKVFGGDGNTLGHGAAKHPLTMLIEGETSHTDTPISRVSPYCDVEPLSEPKASHIENKKTLQTNNPSGDVIDCDKLPGNPNRNWKRLQRVESKIQARQLTGDAFLKKLPPAVVRNGRLIVIREGIAEYCKNSEKTNPIITRINCDVKDENQVQLKIRSTDGLEIFLVYISLERTALDLRQRLETASTNQQRFDLLLRTEGSQYDVLRDEQTLLDCGVVGNSVLHLRSRIESYLK